MHVSLVVRVTLSIQFALRLPLWVVNTVINFPSRRVGLNSIGSRGGLERLVTGWYAGNRLARLRRLAGRPVASQFIFIADDLSG